MDAGLKALLAEHYNKGRAKQTTEDWNIPSAIERLLGKKAG